jgi:uracil-DNA glycosylase
MSLELDTRQRAMLGEMGIKVWWPASVPVLAQPLPLPAVPHVAAPFVQRPSPAAAPTFANPVSTVPLSPSEPLDWLALQQAVSTCQACGLCQSRKNTVFGVGQASGTPQSAPTVDWLIVGEAPGENEDLCGEPFVGAAGKLLDNMLKAIGQERTRNVYITNVLKCRPPANRNPAPAEMAQCAPYLQRQVALLQPKIILALGRFAVQTLLADGYPAVLTVPLGKLRGQVYAYQGVPVVVSYHPAYLLRNLPDKAKAWVDLCLAQEVVRGGHVPPLS